VSELNANGVAKLSNFDVIINGPAGIQDVGVERSIQMRCFVVDLPGRRVETGGAIVYGPPRKIATNSIFDEITLQIILSEDMAEREYFETWFDKIVGNYRNLQSDPNMYDVGFYDDYIGTVEITNYSESGDVIHRTKLIEAYPLNIGAESLSWEQGNQLMILPVTMYYKHYKNEN
jgi:hypothetical protein